MLIGHVMSGNKWNGESSHQNEREFVLIVIREWMLLKRAFSELLHLYTPSCSLRSSSDTCTSTAKHMVFSLSVHTSEIIFPKISGTLLLSFPSKANSRQFSSPNISVKQHCPSPLSVCTMCVCMFVCVHLAHNYASTLVDVYIMCSPLLNCG